MEHDSLLFLSLEDVIQENCPDCPSCEEYNNYGCDANDPLSSSLIVTNCNMKMGLLLSSNHTGFITPYGEYFYTN